MNTKTCTKCGATKPLEMFFRRAKGSKDGRMSHCKDCKTAAIYEWRRKNCPPKQKHVTEEERRQRRREYERSPRVKRYRAEYKARPDRKEKDRLKRQCPKWKKKHRDMSRKRLSGNPKARLHNAMSCRIRAFVKKHGKSWPDCLDFTEEELMAHLERQFLPGMTWDNYGRNGWHIDHIIPVSHYDFESTEDIGFKRCWSLGNLRPVWASENLTKQAKRVFLI